jgi:hypothetical protein
MKGYQIWKLGEVWKDKGKGGAGYEASTCFMARDVIEPAQSLKCK